MSPTTARLSAAERKTTVLDAALIEFAESGYEGTSTEDIARRAGISQPYLFRLFGTKKELFKASVARCFRETLELFQRAAEGTRGEDALAAMGEAYMELLLTDRTRLRAQMQSYAACDDPEICAVVRDGYGDLVAYVQRVSGLPAEDVALFFARGMLLNVLSAMQVQTEPEPWAQLLLEGCGKEA
jgi:AcrR family transcriptional regulator